MEPAGGPVGPRRRTCRPRGARTAPPRGPTPRTWGGGRWECRGRCRPPRCCDRGGRSPRCGRRGRRAASSTALSMSSHSRWVSPSLPVPPMYMPGTLPNRVEAVEALDGRRVVVALSVLVRRAHGHHREGPRPRTGRSPRVLTRSRPVGSAGKGTGIGVELGRVVVGRHQRQQTLWRHRRGTATIAVSSVNRVSRTPWPPRPFVGMSSAGVSLPAPRSVTVATDLVADERPATDHRRSRRAVSSRRRPPRPAPAC